ncbi:MAG: hypothetical protein Q7T82_07115 [Armatimonadota bacterium]|nr:hypothetical protein [Armatimonadota bacterium]
MELANATVEIVSQLLTMPGPLGLSGRRMGGGPMGIQEGVVGGQGLSNIGLLVRCFGKFTYIDARTFAVDDGSTVVVGCVPDSVDLDLNWRFVAVTGISSCRRESGDLLPLLRARSSGDIAPLL